MRKNGRQKKGLVFLRNMQGAVRHSEQRELRYGNKLESQATATARRVVQLLKLKGFSRERA